VRVRAPGGLLRPRLPGHYFRRVKSVGVSVPCVVGPYTGVNGTLTLLTSSLRTKSVVVGSYDAAENYVTSRVPIQSVATSSGQNDSGLVELGLHDDRYLPFEGAGALSRWRLTLPDDFRAFDYATITDVVLHLRYTARDGGALLATKARQTLADRLGALTRAHSTQVGLVQLIPLRLDFAREWQRFRDDHAKLVLQLSEQHFPYMFRGRPSADRAPEHPDRHSARLTSHHAPRVRSTTTRVAAPSSTPRSGGTAGGWIAPGRAGRT